MPPLVSNISLSHRRRYGIQKELKEKNLEKWRLVQHSLFCDVKLGNLSKAKLQSSYSADQNISKNHVPFK